MISWPASAEKAGLGRAMDDKRDKRPMTEHDGMYCAVECPYCGADVEINHDDGYGLEEDLIFKQECD